MILLFSWLFCVKTFARSFCQAPLRSCSSWLTMASLATDGADNTATKKKKTILNINVGVLGHVDSGKTSLVKALSTQLSTASLDKSSESRRRGITLDLGFSAFATELPDQLVQTNPAVLEKYNKLQFTLVDCPGHASLIRTMIAGAQIIDIMVLVIDVNKGIQMQTAECLIIGEVCSNAQDLIVVLNKVDLIPEDKREEHLAALKKKITRVFSITKFANCSMVPVAAAVGGEKRAAVGDDDEGRAAMEKMSLTASDDSTGKTAAQLDSIGMEDLVTVLKSKVLMPNRDESGHLLFAVDHCFAIKGKGTVLTGTVLSGGLAVNDVVEIPALRQEKKIKSIQMFRKPVSHAKQGDRLGICVAGLDANSMERGFIATPGSVPTIASAVAHVRRVKEFFFKGQCATKSKIHVSIGHSTVMASVTFFGSQELAMGGGVAKGAICTSFPGDDEYSFQDGLLSAKQGAKAGQWALLEFEHPVMCPIGSLLIGSRLDTDVHAGKFRIAFFGRLVQPLGKEHGLGREQLRIFKIKQREGKIDRVDKNGTIIVKDLFDKGADMTRFLNMQVIYEDGELGRIDGPFGKSGKVKVKFDDPSKIAPNKKLFLKFKKYIYDEDKKKMHQ